MTSTNNYKIGLVFTISFLIAANVQAEMINWFNDKDTYMNTVGTPDWTFGTFSQTTHTQGLRAWDFTMSNEGVPSTGTLTMSDYNGKGGLKQAPQGDNGTMSFWHNSANNFNISFGDAEFVDSFYMSVAPHSSWSAAINFAVTADYWLDGVKYTTDAVTINQNNAFFGLTLVEGAYLTSINFWSTGTPNNGYKIMAGFGGNYDDNASTPEPATLAVLGLGLAGLGIARRRMKK
ncbi:MAG: PEP-CTERM sorting domain-containing protein [Planctomycetaceae bacterium]|nr:PEP-CTERM sorting domain-containing protein [Planctomycetaceae bacterium]